MWPAHGNISRAKYRNVFEKHFNKMSLFSPHPPPKKNHPLQDCVVPENIHTPPRKVAGISKGEEGQREKFPREEGVHVEPFFQGV